MSKVVELRSGDASVFWGEIAPCEHLVEIYENASVFLDSLEGFVAGGLRQDDAVVVIATKLNLGALEDRLRLRGLDLRAARLQDQYIPLDADETLSKFMVQGWPDEDLFNEFVTTLIRRARGNGRRVRAFGEMVAVLWANGHNGATVRLEHLWHQLCHAHVFSLLCSYPRIGFTQDADTSIQEICSAHSKVIRTVFPEVTGGALEA